MRRLFYTIAILTTALLVLGTKTTYAANASCATVALSQNSGSTTTNFTLTATGCLQAQGYAATIWRDGEPISDVSGLSVGAEGTWSQSLGTFAPGNYEVRFYEQSNPIDTTFLFFSVTSEPVPTEGVCGQLVPAGSNVNCPTSPQCPKKNTSAGGPGGGQNWCACGELNYGCCPDNNALNRTPCQNGLSCQIGVCKLASSTQTLKYYCGEMVRPEDADNFECVGCQAEILSPQGPNGEKYWCSCGGNYQLCCPVNGAPDCEGDCNTKPGLIQCGGSTYSCNGGVCTVPTQQSPAFCSDQKSIFTAIGCIPVDTLTRFAAFFITWGLSIGGGVALIALIASAFLIMTSAGDIQKLATGRELLISSVSGILSLVFSMFILRIIGSNILGLF